MYIVANNIKADHYCFHASTFGIRVYTTAVYLHVKLTLWPKV